MNVETSPSTRVRSWSAGASSALPRAKESLRLQLYAVLMGIDTAALFAGFGIAGLIRHGARFPAHSSDFLTLVVPLYLVFALNNQAYTIRALTGFRFGVARALLAMASAVVAVVLVAFTLKAGQEFSRLVFGGGSVLAALALTGGRLAFRPFARSLCGESPLSQVLLTDGATCPAVEGALVVDADEAGLRPDIRDPMMLDRLGRFLKNADRVIVCCVPERRQDWAMALKGANIRGEIVEPEIALLGALGTARFGEEATFLVSAGALGLRNRAMKRALDLFLAVGALVALAPVMLLTALLIRLEDGGPAFFVQERLGRGNRLFRVYKFRSMKTALCDGAGNRSTSRTDDRITRVGRVIRRTSIDELPQLLNILKGDMSFVGPRPHALGSLAGDLLFWEVDQRYWHRHASKPGLTGLAQVRGFRGATFDRSDLVKRLQADLEYMNDWSLGRDLRILIATLKVLFHKNAF